MRFRHCRTASTMPLQSYWPTAASLRSPTRSLTRVRPSSTPLPTPAQVALQHLLPTLDTHESETYTDTQRLTVALPLSHQNFITTHPSTRPLTHYAGGALSRSASAVLTPIPPSPLTLPSSPDSPPPPPRPPPPLHYTPSQFSSLPRNWGKMRGVET